MVERKTFGLTTPFESFFVISDPNAPHGDDDDLSPLDCHQASQLFLDSMPVLVPMSRRHHKESARSLPSPFVCLIFVNLHLSLTHPALPPLVFLSPAWRDRDTTSFSPLHGSCVHESNLTPVATNGNIPRALPIMEGNWYAVPYAVHPHIILPSSLFSCG